MKSFTSVVLALAAASQVSAHYILNTFGTGSTTYPLGKYLRYPPTNSPVTSLTDNNLRCGLNSISTGVDTVSIAAGTSFTFTADNPIYHQGPVSIYLSKAPGSVASYDGSGAWFKVLDEGPKNPSDANSWPLRKSYTYSLPSCIAPGEYLLRFQQLAIHNPGGVPQFYISCAQINVTGGGSKAPSTTVKIPGFITGTESGYTANIYNGLTSYTTPGGPVGITC